ncbi:hypothetical protein B9Z55_008996 [Caenorhabditis nigoni]|uniref:Uncharacterized protein n=1 Tax=Caenorhabditis nigoni TaxID=1611254 RepID=A0A2G5UQ68_9PELO|nr:hypothetical protein B9Z55_008996 [Caenorhabditis nigoni]
MLGIAVLVIFVGIAAVQEYSNKSVRLGDNQTREEVELVSTKINGNQKMVVFSFSNPFNKLFNYSNWTLLIYFTGTEMNWF